MAEWVREAVGPCRARIYSRRLMQQGLLLILRGSLNHYEECPDVGVEVLRLATLNTKHDSKLSPMCSLSNDSKLHNNQSGNYMPSSL